MGRLIIVIIIAIITGLYVQCAAPAQLNGFVHKGSVDLAIKQLNTEKKLGKKRVLYISSGGGEVGAGLELYAYILDPKNRDITCVAIEAQSMAFFILQACTVRLATPNAVLMTHNIRANFEGAQLKDLKQLVKEIDEIEAIIYPFIAKRMGLKTREDLEGLHRLAKGNYVIDPFNAKNLGIIDGVVELDFKPVQ